MGARRDRLHLRQVKAAQARSKNTPLKIKERERREARMRAVLQSAKPPYPRVVRNWLCTQLGKKEDQITPADVEQVLRGPQ